MTKARASLALGAAIALVANFVLTTGQTAVAEPEAEIKVAAAPSASAPPGKAEQALQTGIGAYKSNKLARAVGSLSNALSSGGLDTGGTARALYYRGLAYRKQGQNALAISDLTNAMWLEGGLSAAERADADANRAAAYKAAGIGDPGAPQAAAAPAVATPATTATALPASASAEPAPARRETPAPAAAAMAPEEQPTQGSQPAANPLAGIGSFFGNLFSGGAQSEPQTAGAADTSPVSTASTGTTSATSSWNSSTEVQSPDAVKSAKKSGRRTAAVSPRETASDAAPAAAPKGKYKLQVAVVRSRAEADKVAQRFLSEHGGKIGQRAPVIEEAVFGNMGTFYRINVGPFASAAEPDKLCQSVRGSGYDCLVVTQ